MRARSPGKDAAPRGGGAGVSDNQHESVASPEAEGDQTEPQEELDRWMQEVVPDPNLGFYLAHEAPHVLATLFADSKKHKDGTSTIRRYKGEWWYFTSGGYERIPDDDLRSDLYRYLARLRVRRRRRGEDSIEPYNPTMSKVTNVADALAALALVRQKAPCWLDERLEPRPTNVIAFANGLIDIEQFCKGKVELIKPTPKWFSSYTLPYEFNTAATCPQWLKFLDDVFDSDAESIALAQEWCGYCMVADTSHEKFMLLVGPRRSGKGTFLAVLGAVLGHEQVAMTNFAKLAGRFALQPLVGRLAAFLPDAHIGKRTDEIAALEMIKSITGRDPQAIDRKFQKELPSEELLVRFTIAVNELPELPDTAGSLLPRLNLLDFPRCFEGREDITLKQRLPAEAPGVAVWALEGLKRLRQQGEFTHPATSADRVQEFRRQGTPVLGFVDDRCELGPDYWANKEGFYSFYQGWCRNREIDPVGKAQFSRQLLAACPTVAACKRGPRGNQIPTYSGIRIRPRNAEIGGIQGYPGSFSLRGKSSTNRQTG